MASLPLPISRTSEPRKMLRTSLRIYYGSQTGNAQEVAERIARLARRLGIITYLRAMDIDTWEPRIETACYVCSTTGQGSEPSNMKRTWKLFRSRSLSGSLLDGTKYGVLGLGDSSYSQYNVVAKRLYKRLQQLGAEPIVELGLADEQHELGAEAVIDPWVNKFFAKILPNYEEILKATGIGNLPSKFTIVTNDEKKGVEDTLRLKQIGEYSATVRKLKDYPICLTNDEFWELHKHPVEQRKLIKKERLTDKSHFQEVQLLTFELEDSSIDYSPGDVLMIQPSNLNENVERFFKIFPSLNKKRDEKVHIELRYNEADGGNVKYSSLPIQLRKFHKIPWNWYQIVTHYFDLQAIPKRYFFELLAKFTTEEIKRDGLLDLISPEGQQNLISYCNHPKRNILDVLEDFLETAPNIPEEYLFDLISEIKPRAFSIASSLTREKNTVQILMAVVNYKTKLNEPRLGLCSNWLNRLAIGTKVPLWVEKGSFKFPPNEKETPIIMVGPGTGVAPFRSLITDRMYGYNKLVLFFGCRYESKDFYYKDDFLFLKEDNALELFTAFSRDNPDAGRTYVQHRIEEQAGFIGDLIVNKGAYIYVAGNAKQMPVAVAEAFKKALLKTGVKNPGEFVKGLVKDGRYQMEVW